MENTKAISLHIGVNSVDPGHYGSDYKLQSCEFDAKDMMNIAQSLNYDECNLLFTKDAKRENVFEKIKSAAATLNSGDLFLLTYSGHGGRVPDKNCEEPDGLDETWLLYDDFLIDDELYLLWSEFKEGVRIFVLSDSCHSGSIVRLIPGFDGAAGETDKNIRYKYVPDADLKKVYEKNVEYYDKLMKDISDKKGEADVLCSVRLISACQDEETAVDRPNHGLFTNALLNVWDDGKFSGNYSEFCLAISGKINFVQNPNNFFVGVPNPDFDNQKPFTK